MTTCLYVNMLGKWSELLYTLPEDFSVDFLAGCYLDMVGFGPYITKLDFVRAQAMPGERIYKVTFCVESILRYNLNGISGYRDFSHPETCGPLVGALLRDVSEVLRCGDAGIEIRLGGVGNITIDADKTAEFESYSIYLPSGDIVVV